MLLPSALSCDAQSQSVYAKTSSTTRRTLLAPPRAAGYCQSPTTSSPNIFAACSALQSLLASTLPLPTTTTTAAMRPSATNGALDSPISFITPPSSKLLSSSKIQKSKKQYPSQGPKASRIKQSSQYTPPPAPSRKRHRDDDDDDNDDTSSSKNNIKMKQLEGDKENDTNKTSAILLPITPKRSKRHCPAPPPRTPCSSRGSSRMQGDTLFFSSSLRQHPHHDDDKDTRGPQRTPFQLQPQIAFISPSHPAPLLDDTSSSVSHHHQDYHQHQPHHQENPHQDQKQETEHSQTQTQDDTRLMNLILTKLQLRHRRKSDWTAAPCTTTTTIATTTNGGVGLGSGSSTIEERFQLLVGGEENGADGMLGLGLGPFRRGEGGLRRGSVKCVRGVEF